MNINYKQEDGDIFKGLVAGIVGGLAASLVMNKFQAVWSEISESLESSKSNGSKEKSGKDEKSGKEKEKQEPATVKVAEAIAENVFGHELTKKEKKYAGPPVHYATGAGSAAVYGVAAELFPEVTVGAGLPFGAAVWLIVDEGAVPALGFSKSPLEYPPSTHAYALVSHLVYGLSTEIVRRAVRRALD